MTAVRRYPDGTATVALELGDEVVGIDATTGNVTVNLPSSVSFAGRTVRIYLIATAGGHTATVTPFAGDTIGGASTYVLDTANDVVMATADGGTDWPGPIKSSSNDASAVAADLAAHVALTSTAHSIATQIAAIVKPRTVTFLSPASPDLTNVKVVLGRAARTTVISSIYTAIVGSTSVAWAINQHADLSNAGTSVTTDTTTNTTGGQLGGLSSATITAGNYYWLIITAIVGTPDSFTMSFDATGT